MKDTKNSVIIILAAIIVILFVLLVAKNNQNTVQNNPKSINKSVQKTIKKETATTFPQQSPTVVIKDIINSYKTCANTPTCPLSSSFRSRAQALEKANNPLNPITRMAGGYINPIYSVITELPTISIIKVTNQSGSNAIEFDLTNIKNSWELTNTYCYSNPQSAITDTKIISCN